MVEVLIFVVIYDDSFCFMFSPKLPKHFVFANLMQIENCFKHKAKTVISQWRLVNLDEAEQKIAPQKQQSYEASTHQNVSNFFNTL